jgi:Bacterial regulatory helix-turn-helix protein, lysR family
MPFSQQIHATESSSPAVDAGPRGCRRGAAMGMHQIRYFPAVCKTLNFTRAAEQCHVTQLALTHAIQKLEEELGGLPFRRKSHLPTSPISAD